MRVNQHAVFLIVGVVIPTSVSAMSAPCTQDLSRLGYPASALTARIARIQGTVNMNFTVDPDGKPIQIESNAYHPAITKGGCGSNGA